MSCAAMKPSKKVQESGPSASKERKLMDEKVIILLSREIMAQKSKVQRVGLGIFFWLLTIKRNEIF